MALSPDHGARLATAPVNVVIEAELVMLRLIARYIRQGIDAPQWAVEKLAQLQMLRAQLTSTLTTMQADAAASILSAYAQAYTAGQAEAVADLDTAGIPPTLPPAQFAAMSTLAYDTVAAIRGVEPLVLRRADDLYREIVGRFVGNVTLGVATRRQVAQQVLNEFAAHGIGAFTDASGRSWYLPSYVEMAVRTGAGQAALAGHTQTLAASGHDLIKVIPGVHPCPDCDQWRGRVLSISGATGDAIGPGGRVGVTPLAVATAGNHLFGPNCRCTSGIYLPGITPLDDPRPDGSWYEADQEQRRLERKVREWKRRQALAITPEADAAAAAKVRQWQAAVRDHLREHPYLRRKYARESITRAI